MEMINLLEENAELERRAEESTPPPAPSAQPSGAVQAQLAALVSELERARQACDRAKQRAGHLRRELDQARVAPAPEPAAAAGDNGVRVLAMAQHTADQHLHDARRESESVLAEARERSGRLVREAREKAGDIEREARRRHAEAQAQLQARHDGLLRDIGEMTTFAEGYQAALKDHIVRQSEHLGDATPA
jgi:cell division septum initiation protein DivIVA